ncbi:hypothetical protein QBC34DRAFT_331477, partial [Podospora aff. communis PSN243]
MWILGAVFQAALCPLPQHQPPARFRFSTLQAPKTSIMTKPKKTSFTSPDPTVLAEIFPHFTDKNWLESTSWLPMSRSELFADGTFRIKLSSRTNKQHVDMNIDSIDLDRVLKLRTAEKGLKHEAQLQRFAHGLLPDLVPQVLDYGTIKTKGNAELDYLVMPVVQGAHNLEHIWDDLEQENRQSLVESAVSATRKIHLASPQGDLADISTQLLDAEGRIWPLGSPLAGGYPDITSLLRSQIGAPPGCEIDYALDGIEIRSHYERDPVTKLSLVTELSSSDLDELMGTVGLCHNDLEPRNILVKKVETGHGGRRYELAAIIDWKKAGFFPSAYEYRLKDEYIGLDNMTFNIMFWDTAYRQLT